MDQKTELGLFRAAFENATDAMIIADETGDIAVANRAAHRILGYEQGSLLQLSIDELVPSDVRHTHAEQRDSFMNRPSPRAMTDRQQIRAVRNDGSSFPAYISLSPIKHAGKTWVLAVVRNVSRLRQLEEKVRRIGYVDTLTGLYNRAFFETEVARLSRSRSNIGIILAALPDLKETIEKHGGLAADASVTTLAAILRGTARGSDIAARVNSDVIAILLPGVPSDDVISSLVHRIQRKIAATNEHADEDRAIHAVFSIALASPGIELEAALHEAQRGLAREAKRRASEFPVI